MEIEIKQEQFNQVLGRNEISFEINSKQTPSREAVIKKLSALKNAEEAVIALQYIKQKFGRQMFYGKAHLYKNAESMKKTEPKYLLKRGVKKDKANEKAGESK